MSDDTVTTARRDYENARAEFMRDGYTAGLWVSMDRKLDALIVAARTEPAWQPIESAPKDGTNILLRQGDLLEHGAWGFIETSDWDGVKCYGWLTDYGHIDEPTHWMRAILERA